MENLIKTTAFFDKETDMGVWIGTKEDDSRVYNWMHGDDYEEFSENYCRSDEALSYFINEVAFFSGDLYTGTISRRSIVDLIWIFINLELVIHERANK